MKKSPKAHPVGRKLRQGDAASSIRTGMRQGPKRKLPQPVAKPKPVKTSQDEDVHTDPGELTLVRYINDAMIKKMAGKDVLRDITSLNLTLTMRDDGKKIRYIENMDGLINLQVLKMSHNQISKIERLHHLTRLRELDISCNRIAKIEGLDTLIHLQTLNLSHNLIETIPAWLAKKLKALRAFHIAGNLLYSLSDVFRLRPLKDLVHLSIADNPLCDLPHHQLFAVFHLRSLQVLDKRPVIETERQQADERFEQEELENLEVQLGEEEKKLRCLQEDHNKTVTEQKQSKNLISSLKTRNLDHQRTILQLQGELQAQTDLLKRKTAELNKACQKQYRLEQELAFQKIDAKFEPLEFRNDLDETDGGTEESPYIGKAGYKRNQLAHQQYLTPRTGHSVRGIDQRGQETKLTTLSPETQGQLNAVLDDRLTDKQRQIAAAQEQLSKLHDKIDDAEGELDAKKTVLQQLSADKRPLSEAEKHELRRRLWERLEAVKDLRHRVAEVESAMAETLDIIQEREEEMERLRRQLPSTRHPKHAEASAEIANKEQETASAGDKYKDLQQELEEVVALLAGEMEKVNRVKQQMAQDKVDLNDSLKGELEETIAGLTKYMHESQRRAAEQDRKNKVLLRERDALRERLHQVEEQRKRHRELPDEKRPRGSDDFLHDFEDLEEMQRKLDAAEEALAAAEAEKERLRTSLTAEQDGQLTAMDEKLRSAEEESKKLNTVLKRQTKQAQAEKEALKRQLDAQRRQMDHLKHAADQPHDLKELENLSNQLQRLQAERDELENHLQDQQAEMQDALDASLNPDDVVSRINQMRRHLEQGRGKMRPVDEADSLGRSLADVEDTVRDRMRDAQGEREEARRKQQEAEQEVEGLRRQVAALQEQLEQAEYEHQRYGVDTPDFIEPHEVRDEGRHGRGGPEEDAMVDAMRQEVRRLQEKLRRRPAQPFSQDQVMSTLRPEHDPHTMAELEHLIAALADTQRQMRNNDQLAAEELARADAEMRHLQDELDHRVQLARDREQDAKRQMEQQRREASRMTQEAIAEVESRARERARQAAQELARAEDDLAGLHQDLADRERRLREEMQRGDLASQTVGDQQREIGALHDTLEDQKAEIMKLHDALNRLITPGPGAHPPARDRDLDHLLREIDRLNHALQQQRNYMSSPDILQMGYQQPTMAGRQQAGSRPRPYQYNPIPDQPRWDTIPQVLSGAPPIPPNQPTTLYPGVVPADWNGNGPPPPTLTSRGRPLGMTAIPNSQIVVDSLPPVDTQMNRPYINPHGNTRTVPSLFTGHPGAQGQKVPQSATEAMHSGIATNVNNQRFAGSIPAVPKTQFVAGNRQSSHQPGLLMGQGVAGTIPPGTLTMQTPGATMQPPQQAGVTAGTQGGYSVVQSIPNTTAGVAPPSSQPITTGIPLMQAIGALPGVPTPGLVLGTTAPAQSTAAKNPPGGSGNDAPTGNETADTSTEGDTESTVPPVGRKPGRTIILPPGGLFCNVPEHHDMEDEMARLKKLLAECRKSSKKRRGDSTLEKIESILEDRTKELDALDLAIQRQHDTLKVLHDADTDIQRRRDVAAQELQELNANIDRRTRRRDFLDGRGTITPEEVDYEMLEASMDQEDLEDEIGCLERTLRKRRAELRVADKLLQECQADLKDATDQARGTLEKYDKATLNLKQTEEDAEELEKRSVQVSKDLVLAQQHLEELQRDVLGMEEEKADREAKMKTVDEVLGEKDKTFKGLATKIEQATDRLQKLETDLLVTEESVSEKQEHARQQNQLIADRTADLHRLEEQVDEETRRLADLDREIGRKQTDLQALTADLDTNHKEMVSALRDAETELTTLKQKVKETKVVLDDLKHQKRDLQASIEDQQDSLAKRRQDTEEEERSLQDVRASIDKGRADLKHTREMIQLEKMELEALRLQHDTKMGDLEKTQLTALQEKSELETLQLTSQEKRSELDRINTQLSLQRTEKDRLTTETAAVEARATTLHREEEGLEERCRQWDEKVTQLTRQHAELLNARQAEDSRLEELQQDLVAGRENLDKINTKRALLTNQLGSYKQQVKETAKELKSAREDLQKVEDLKQRVQQELQEHERQKAGARGDLAELRASVEKTKQSLLRVTDEHRAQKETLHRLKREVVERIQEAENGQHHVERVQADVEQEENRLSRVIGGLTVEAEHLQSDIAVKTQELEAMKLKVLELHRQYEQHQQDGLSVAELQTRVTQLEGEVKERQDEKTKLAEALNFSHTEINSLRKDKESLEKRLSEITSHLEANEEKLRQAKLKFRQKQRELEREIEESTMAANEHCSRADRLSIRLKEMTQQYIQHQSQSSRDLDEERKAKMEALEKLRELSRKEEVSSIDGTSDLDELEDLQQQKMDLTRHLVELQSNIQQARLDASLIREGDFLHDMSSTDESRWRQDQEKAKMQEEQDRLKLQIRQRVSRQADMLDNVKEKANLTLHSLKRKLDNLEGLVSNNSAMGRSLTGTESGRDSDISQTQHGSLASDHYPQHDTTPIKMTSSNPQPRGILKTSQAPPRMNEIDEVPSSSVPSRTYSSQRHRRTSPSRTEQHTHRQTAVESNRYQYDDFMDSLQRLKEEKLAQIGQSSHRPSKPSR